MTDKEIIELVNRSLVSEFELDPGVMTPDALLVEGLGFDSLDFVDVVVVLQQAFGVTLREEPRVREVRTLGDLHRAARREPELAARLLRERGRREGRRGAFGAGPLVHGLTIGEVANTEAGTANTRRAVWG